MDIYCHEEINKHVWLLALRQYTNRLGMRIEFYIQILYCLMLQNSNQFSSPFLCFGILR